MQNIQKYIITTFEQVRKYIFFIQPISNVVYSLTQVSSHSNEQLFSDILHALQTPLSVLNSAIEIVETNSEIRQIETLKSMRKSIDDLTHFNRELVEFARIGTMPDEKLMVINFSEVTEQVIEYVAIVARQNRIHLQSYIEPSCYVLGNEKQLETLVINLLSNAIKYTVDCEKREVGIMLKRVGVHMLQLYIEDSGIGIPEELLPNIFSRFYRVGEHASSGTGLGLPIAKRIVECHKGTIYARSIHKSGTSMIVVFPFLRDYESRLTKEASEHAQKTQA